VNSDLVGKYVNIAAAPRASSASASPGKLSEEPLSAARSSSTRCAARSPPPTADDDQAPQILFEVRSFADAIAADYEAREFSKAIRQVMFLADRVNQYVDEQKPWEIAKEPGQDAALQWFCTLYLELFRILTIYLKPVLPKMSEDVEAFLGVKPLDWEDVGTPLKPGHTVQPYKHLVSRIDPSRSTSCWSPPRGPKAPRPRSPRPPRPAPSPRPSSSWSRSSRPSRP
jgi:methionyl-tRNA synthetase